MAIFTINVGPFDSATTLRQWLSSPGIEMLSRADSGFSNSPGYIVELAQGWRADNTGAEGVYCTVIIDDAIATSASQSIAALGTKVLPAGNTPNRVLGLPELSADDIPARIQRVMNRRLFNSGFDIGTGAAKRWYFSDPGYLALYGVWNSLAARMTDAEFDALSLRVQHMDGRTTVLTRTLAQTIAVEAAKSGELYRTRARQALNAWTTSPSTFKFSEINWPAGYGE